jgi:hypothetical protein
MDKDLAKLKLEFFQALFKRVQEGKVCYGSLVLFVSFSGALKRKVVAVELKCIANRVCYVNLKLNHTRPFYNHLVVSMG